jgi:hypothetical protein
METIDKHHSDLDKLRWISRAICKDKKRTHLNVICVVDGKAIATDEHRLHMAPVSIPDGCYSVVKNTKTLMILVPVNEMEFPDVDRIIWSEENAAKEQRIDINRKNYWVEYINFVCNMAPVNGDYFWDMLDGQKNMTAYVRTERKITEVNTLIYPVLFKGNDDRVGLLMPMRL